MRHFVFRITFPIFFVFAGYPLMPISYAALDSGAEIYNEFLEKDLIYPDQEWQQYVLEVGERLLGTIPSIKKQYVFVVVDQSIVNAWATPDGYVFLTRGLLAHLNSEDEMASVIGHEIGHVIGEHSKKTVGRDRLNKMMGILGMFATGTSATSSLVNTIGTAQLASYRREHELEADEFGLRYLISAGYDPHASLESIQKVRDHDNFSKSTGNQPTIYHGILGSHPAHAKRLNELIGRSRELSVFEVKQPERDYYSMLSGLRYGEEASTGVIKQGKYYHGSLRIVVEFPEGWNLSASNAEILARSQLANENSSIVLKRMAPSAEVSTPEQYLIDVLKRDDLIGGEQLQVGYMSAFVATVKGSGKSGLSKIAVLFKDGGVYLFSGEYKAGPNQKDFAEVFYKTIGSFRSMTADDMRVISNQRIKVIMANPGDTFSKMAIHTPIGVGGEKILRLLNGHYPNGEPRAGDLVKVVE